MKADSPFVTGSEPESAVPAARRRRERPEVAMVPLSEFGKTAPPPPRQPLSLRTIAILIGAIVVIVVVLAVGFIYYGGQSATVWGSTKCLDVRRGC